MMWVRMFAHVKEMYLITKGKICSTYANGYSRISYCKFGYFMDRDPCSDKKQKLEDIIKHRESLIQELVVLSKAETLLRSDSDKQ